MQSSEAYAGIFPETYCLINIMLTLPVGTATVERSFSQTKIRLRNRLSDLNLTRLMRIAIEGPQLNLVNFNEILDIFKEQSLIFLFVAKILGGGGGGFPRVPPYETLHTKGVRSKLLLFLSSLVEPMTLLPYRSKAK